MDRARCHLAFIPIGNGFSGVKMMRRTAVKAVTMAALAGLALGACGSSSDATATGGETGGGASAKTTNPAPIHGSYSPQIDPANFVPAIDNRYLPFEPGTTLRYRGVAENGKTPQLDTETVTRQTKRIIGVECTVVLDTVSSRGKPVERTLDWYAQDRKGNVWYFGEDARDFQNGRFVKASDSWQTGVDGAQPGVIMEAHPKPGDAYRQEYYPGHAVDQAEVLGHAAVKVPFRSFPKALVTVERSALEPGAREKKFNVAGIGVVAERVVKGNHERFDLVGVSR
jgi:hypothetical protein